MSQNPGSIPARWLHCPRKADDLIIGKFMAFKTPLSSKFDSQVPPACRFPPDMLFGLFKAKKVKFGLWIDLTYTKRFYDKDEIEAHDCKYVKLQCRGHGESPSVEQTRTFIDLVRNFCARSPLEAIAVHCTHGFNRTGFLIVSYLVETTDCSLEMALDMFAAVRPPGIYKSDYIRELYGRYYGNMDDAPSAPERPDWACDEGSDPEDEDFNLANMASTSTAKPPRGQNKRKQVPQFMDGVPGVTPVLDQTRAKGLQKKVCDMCGWQGKGFPGCQPVTMGFSNLEFLMKKPYMVSWKADGTRYLMLIDGVDRVYFFDRDHNVFQVTGLKFPHRKNLESHLSNTLLDGEMVIDKVNGVDIPRYLAYDIIVFNGELVGKTPFRPTRLHCLEYEIVNPRIAAMECGLIDKSTEPFSVRKKHFWEIAQAENLLGEKFAATLSHEPDGLIFQPAKEPYVAGRSDNVLKWKPEELNSVDFKMKIVREEQMGCIPRRIIQLFVGKKSEPFAVMKYTKELKDLDGKIIECKFEDNQWVFMRQRVDKSFPNSYDTAASVCKSIQKPVTKAILLQYIRDISRTISDREIMPPPKRQKIQR